MLSLYNKVQLLNFFLPKPQLKPILFKFNNKNIFKEEGESQPIWFNISIKPNLKLYKESLGEISGIGKIDEMDEIDIIEYYI